MNKPIILIVLILSLNMTYAKDEVDGVGRFLSTPEDSISVVKNELIYLSLRDIIAKELTNMQLSSEAFLQRFDEKVTKAFEPIKLAVEKKYKVDIAELSAKDKQNFDKELRAKELRHRFRWSKKLKSLLRSYSIVKMSRSSDNPHRRYMKLSGRLDRKSLYQLYQDTMWEGEIGKISKIFLQLDVTVERGDWTKLGVDNRSNFHEALTAYWKKWFEQSSGIDEVEVDIIDEGEARDLEQNWRLGPLANNDDSSASRNGLWIKLDYHIYPGVEEELLSKREFDLSAKMIVLDLRVNQIFYTDSFFRNNLSFIYKDETDLSSKIASTVSAIPLSAFNNVKKKLSKAVSLKSLRQLQIVNSQNSIEVKELQDYLEKKGVAINLTIDFYSQSEEKVVLNLLYSGDQEKLKAIMLQLDQRGLKSGKKMVIPDHLNPYEIYLIGKGDEIQPTIPKKGEVL